MAPDMMVQDAPLLTKPATQETPHPEGADDVADPPVPETLQTALREEQTEAVGPDTPGTAQRFGEHEALLQGAVQYIKRQLEDQLEVYARDLYKSVDDVCMYLKHQMDIAAEKWTQVDALLQALQRQTSSAPAAPHPHVAQVHFASPQGLPLSITVATTNPDSVRTATAFLTAQLVEIGCQVQQP
jgi:hypothetical protein